MATTTLKKQLIYTAQYYEYKRKIEGEVEISRTPFTIDGLFDPVRICRYSLGYLVNLKRTSESLHYLTQLGRGVEFAVTQYNEVILRSKSLSAIYFCVENFDKQQVLLPGDMKVLFEVTDVYMPKDARKQPNSFDKHRIRLSFGRPFEVDLARGKFNSPCWLDMNLTRLVNFD